MFFYLSSPFLVLSTVKQYLCRRKLQSMINLLRKKCNGCVFSSSVRKHDIGLRTDYLEEENQNNNNLNY